MAANPATGGYWGGSHAKGNRTRRQDQEAYRKALDSQIVERIEMDKKCLEKNKKEFGSQKPISDPIQHLMPWRTNSETNAPFNHQSHPTHSHQTSSFPQSLPPPQEVQQSQPGQPYPYGSPNASSFYVHAASAALPPPSMMPSAISQQQLHTNYPTHPNSHPSHQFHPQQNVAYGYYGTPQALPPLPAYAQPAYIQAPGYLPYHQQSTPMVPCGVQQALQHPVPPPPPQHLDKEVDKKARSARAEQEKDYHKAKETANKDAHKSDGIAKKQHISQLSEDAPDQEVLKNNYREELRRQMEHKQRLEEERKIREKVEEDELQRKIKEDQERLQRAYEEEERKRLEKEQEKRKKDEEVLRRTQELQEQERVRREQEKERLKREKEEKKRQAILEEQKLYEIVSAPPIENPFDSTPLPNQSKGSEGTPLHDLGGGGDNNMSKYNHSPAPAGLTSRMSTTFNPVTGESYTKAPEKPKKVTYARNETYRKRNSHSAIGEPFNPTTTSHEAFYIPTPTAINKRNTEESKVQQKNPVKMGTRDSVHGGNSVSVKLCPNCKHSFSSQETEDTNESTKCSQINKEGIQFLAKLKQVLKQEEERTNEEVKSFENDKSPIISICGKNVSISG